MHVTHHEGEIDASDATSHRANGTAALLCSELTAQQADCPRSTFVFHIYVDPLFGDNGLATDFNPRNFGTAHFIIDYGVSPQPFDFTAIVNAGMNSPGTFFPAATYLIPPSAQFGPFGPCSGSTLAFGAWSFNELPSGCPDVLPNAVGEDGLGRRFNLELGPGQSNLQTFLSIQPQALPPAEAEAPEGLEAVRSRVRAASEMMRTGR